MDFARDMALTVKRWVRTTIRLWISTKRQVPGLTNRKKIQSELAFPFPSE